MPRRVFVISALALGLIATARGQEDPVLKARAQRSASLGLSDGDLPPLPRGIAEPPPLPPPETHVKDTRRGRRVKHKKPVHKKGHAQRKAPRKAPHAKAAP
jgi:hypothetical protein